MTAVGKITPVLLAGGYGTRLWPLSRKSYPKQFSSLIGTASLFQESALRLQTSPALEFKELVTLTNTDFRFIVREQLEAVGIDFGSILIEPSAKNTAPAILAASLVACKEDPNAVLLVCPSDHLIPDQRAFHATVANGLSAVEAGNLVVFGIEPTRPEIGYGYLELEQAGTMDATKLKRFVEKPVKKVAEEMFNSGKYLWNAGIFLFQAKDLLEAFEAYCPNLLQPVSEALENSKHDLGFLRLDPKSWNACEDISIDYAVMEQSSNLMAVPFSGEWSDLGEWGAVWDAQGPDATGVVTSEGATAIECKNVLLRSENSNQQLVGLGLEDIVAIAMPDAVLVVHKNRVQDVKNVVTNLKKQNVSQAEIFPKDHRPWGWFETLTIQGRFQVKRILVHPGAALSLQSHHHRSEHWIVVEGTAKVTIDDCDKLVTEGESVYIPLGAVHRMENPGIVPMVLIEVQTGAYLGEDDIIRYEDVYDRG
jgi:mannose-1-phosphate guanylyltransferase / mannose-6-phosphate isomerase